MKKIAILAMSILIAGAAFAQTPQVPAKNEVAKTERIEGDKKVAKKPKREAKAIIAKRDSAALAGAKEAEKKK